MLTIPRAIVTAAGILALAFLLGALLPRYHAETHVRTEGVPIVVRYDRWTGTVELGTPEASSRPAWLAVASSASAR